MATIISKQIITKNYKDLVANSKNLSVAEARAQEAVTGGAPSLHIHLPALKDLQSKSTGLLLAEPTKFSETCPQGRGPATLPLLSQLCFRKPNTLEASSLS